MNGWLNVVVGVVLGLVVNECTDMSPWLAHRLVRWAAVIRQPARVEDFVEARSATINDRPGRLLKLFTALGFLFAALVHRAAERGPSLLGVLRVRVMAAGIASALYAVTWVLIGFFLGSPDIGPVVVTGSALFVAAMVVLHLPVLRPRVAIRHALLPTALVSWLWLGAEPVTPFVILTMLAPVYGVAQVVLVSLRDRRLLAGIGSVVAVGAVVTIAAVVTLETSSPYDDVVPYLLGFVGLGVVGGLHVGVGLLVVEHVRKKWNPVVVTPSHFIPV